MFKLGIILGYGGSSIKTFADVASSLGEKVEIKAAFERSEVDWHEFFHWIEEEADAIFIYSNEDHERLKRNDKVTVHLRKPEKSSVSLEDFAKLEKYYKYGGEENLKNLVLYLGALCGYDFEPKEPEEVPWQGIYHPNLGIKRKAEEYKRDYQREIQVGILFYRSRWVDGLTSVVDSLIKELEERNIGVIPVFSYGFEDKRLGIPGNEKALELMRGVDLILNLQSFFLNPKALDNEEIAKEDSILSELNTPTLKGIKEYYKTEEEWREDPQGISPMVQITTVAQPEFDGIIEPILVAAKKEVKEPKVSGSFKVYSPIEDRIKYLTDRVEGWLKLKSIQKEKRRVTFVLHNAPCKSVEATVGKGSGLDTLESVVRIMKRLKVEGYSVEDIPENGEELIDQVMEKKAISEFRWTTTDEIVKKGGVLEFVSKERYSDWFSSFPEDAQKKVLDGWGEPPGEGMVHEGEILVTGLRFGNVNIVVQPKRGCYGAKCDGKVCKILHDPFLPPPHHWIATYKWIQENSDVIVHVGTHGYLEFLPGKGVGLASEDFPEISIGKKPHLYIYTVKNPMEGTIAKRRSYATIIDHLIPVMKPSGLYDELEELEELLRQYEDAESLEEESRAKILKEEIIEKAKEANLDEEAEDEDFSSYIDRLHERISQFRDTQIPYGLHILSEAPQGDELVDLLVSILRFDGEIPSIRRKILEVQGIDYSKAVENPKAKHKGKRYGEIISESTQIAKELMKIALGG